MMIIVCTVLVVVLLCILFRHLHFIWQIKDINRQIEFINTHQTNMIVSGEYGNGCINDLINNINYLSKQCSKFKAECLANEDKIKETVTNISHDIRTPLTSLSGYFQLMCQCGTMTEQKEYSKIIMKQISTLEKMLEELFTYAKLSNKSYQTPLDRCCVNQILRDTIFGFYNDFKKANITPDCSIPEVPIYAFVNDVALRRVFQNILKNVIEHGEKAVGISMQQKNREIEVVFYNHISSDTKIDVERIFERFYKSDLARTSKSTGLGLSIAKELLTRMNGEISASIEDSIFKIIVRLEIVK